MLDNIFRVLASNIFFFGIYYWAAYSHNSSYNEDDHLEKTTIKRFKRLFLFGKKDKNILKYCYQIQALAICAFLLIVLISGVYFVNTNLSSQDYTVIHQYYLEVGEFYYPLSGGLMFAVLAVIAHTKADKERKANEQKRKKKP